MQDTIDRWEGGLKSTGGAIVPEKSWVYPIKFHFDDKNKAMHLTPEEIDTEFTVVDTTGERVQLESYSASTWKETLGVYLAPDGNNDAVLEALISKANTWKDNI